MVFNEHLLSPLPGLPHLILTFLFGGISSLMGGPKAYYTLPLLPRASQQGKADNRSQSKPPPLHHPASCRRLTAQLPRAGNAEGTPRESTEQCQI